MINWHGKKVLVCGGAGFIGSHLSRKLIKEGADVRIIDDLSSGSQANVSDLVDSAEFLKYDLRSYVTCQRLFQIKPDVIFQLAANMGGIGWITSIGADIMHDSGLINIQMLELAHKHEIEHYFYSSSACIYPNYLQIFADVKPLAEVDAYPAEPDQFYGWEKLFTEKLCEAYQLDYGMNIKVARFHNIFGECFTSFDKDKGKAPAHMIIKAIKHPEPPFLMWGDGKQTRSFLYIDDCVNGILKLMNSDFDSPINIGSDYLVDMNSLAKLAIDFSGKEVDIIYDTSKPQGVRGRNADLELVEKELDWLPEISLEEGMKKTYEWAVKNYNKLENI